MNDLNNKDSAFFCYCIHGIFCASQDGMRDPAFLRAVSSNSKVFLHGL